MEPRLAPTLWRTCRVLAHAGRLCVLAEVCAAGPVCVSDLARRRGLTRVRALLALRLLQSRGLLAATRTSRWVAYRAQAEPSVEHAAGMLAALQRAFRRCEKAADLLAALTAFTHPRRLRVARQLAASGLLSADALVARCAISRPALYRHLDKLERRRFVQAATDGTWRLAPPRPGFAGDVLRLVLSDARPDRAPRAARARRGQSHTFERVRLRAEAGRRARGRPRTRAGRETR